MSSRLALTAGVLLASLAAVPASAQQSVAPAPRDTSAARSATHETSADSALAELGRALTQFAASVQTAVAETAKNPEVRREALSTADKAVTVAHRTLVEHTDDIERLLQQASKQLEALAAKEQAKTTTARPPAASSTP
jgi:hypothetical protein